MAQTQAALPTSTVIPTATVVPLNELDIKSILIIEGDLPPGFEAAQIRSTFFDLSKDSPTPDLFASKSFSHNGRTGGAVEVLLFEDVNKIYSTYKDIVDNKLIGDIETVNVGEQGTKAYHFIEPGNLVFYQCHALVVIQFLDSVVLDDMVFYGQRLDNRLQQLVCP